MIALSSMSRNTRGFSLPGCGSGVTDPISTNPKPELLRPSTASPCLSKPAAIPSGFCNVKFKNFVFCWKILILHKEHSSNILLHRISIYNFTSESESCCFCLGKMWYLKPSKANR